MPLARKLFVRNHFTGMLCALLALALSIFLSSCGNRKNTVSGTIEVDEAHVGPRSSGRVEKVFAQEGDRLHEGQLIVQLAAPELRARRELAAAQIDTAIHDADAQAAQMKINQARAQLADIDAQLKEMQVLAPSESILEVLNVKVGDILIPPFNQEVATLLLPQHLWVRVYVPEPWLGKIKIGDQVRVRVDSFPGKNFPGEIEQVNRQAEFTPRNVQTVEDRIRQVFGVKIRLPNNDDRLRAGMAADVYFPNVK